ncbi:MAG: HD domain-containing protein [Bacteroidales bacterium]|nr:HD domain-containing protein [Bacteroidales bacterium]NPV37494.1 HD domain-containing protein [Bacteroidales bacterium]
MLFNPTILEQPVFKKLTDVAHHYQVDVYLIGGFVRDLILGNPGKEIDILVVGDGVEFARNFSKTLDKPTKVTVYKTFGTASLHYRDDEQWELEFVGARKESYAIDSRKPFVEPGSLVDDLNRRDFTINALAISLNKGDYGQFLDHFKGLDDLRSGIIRTPLDPDITFSDDPLRMMRAIRFATRLDFKIEPATYSAIRRNTDRLGIVSIERIMDEFNKILMCNRPSRGLNLLRESGLMAQFFPEILDLAGVEYIDGKGHKDNFKHTLEVLNNISRKSDNLWLRWAALLHDIAKPVTRRFDPQTGWSFHGHEIVGSRMVKQLFRRLKLPLNEKMEYVAALVQLHLRPIALVDEEVTDSAIRRLLFDAGDLIDDLMLLCEADITSKNPEKVRRYLRNFEYVKQRMKEVEERDRVRNFQPPISGDLIMQIFGITPSYPVGLIKNNIKDAILDGKIHNNYDEAFSLMLAEGERLGLKPVDNMEELKAKFRKD